MDEATYKVWWDLHIRNAKGETLSPEEEQVYQAGCREFDAEETLDGGLTSLQQSRDRVQKLKDEYLRLQQQYELLEAERMEIEARLSEKDKRLLSVGGG